MSYDTYARDALDDRPGLDEGHPSTRRAPRTWRARRAQRRDEWRRGDWPHETTDAQRHADQLAAAARDAAARERSRTPLPDTDLPF